MKIFLDPGAITPTRGHPMDAGLDLRTPYDFTVPPNGSSDINTGVHVKLPTDTVGLITSKSGLMRDKGIRTDGTIDNPYRGSIHVILFNDSNEPVEFKKGDKIAQLVIVPCVIVDVEEMPKINDLGKTDRGSDGFGSTGR